MFKILNIFDHLVGRVLLLFATFKLNEYKLARDITVVDVFYF